ncbi:MAG: hypothetical protein A2728_00165 [Candidatus Spechtbacteria bacterium RIFCSPHIGHO2_01_FULL_38_11]|nr:MAG: hypothetical protein A2728_00165 [Candidatus Spechtbacteria bacterium RIFCSPHIGHO2_01_FULL_38_11]
MSKKITLNFVEEAILSSKELSNTHAGGRIELLDSEKEYHTEEIRLLLPRSIFQALREKLEGMVIEIK